jgi:hypothetical protein
MRQFRSSSVARAIGVLVVLAGCLLVPSLAAGSASASAVPKSSTSAPGHVSCTFSATVSFSPVLKNSGGGTRASAVTGGRVSKCHTTTSSVAITSGIMAGSFARSPLTCKNDALTGASPTLTVSWKGTLSGKAVTFTNTVVRGTRSTGSFAGPARVALTRPARAPAACATSGGLKSLVMSGTVTAGTPPAPRWWIAPAGKLPWQWYLAGSLDLSNASQMGTNDKLSNGSAAPAPVVYDVDGIENSASTVSALHARHDHVICYIEVGTAGDYYTAAQEGIATTYFQQLKNAGDLSANELPGYSEYFIDINQSSAVTIIESMIKQQCANKGFDAVETDLDETFGDNEGTTPWTITEANEQTYLTKLAGYMHSVGLGWIAKNLDDLDDGFAGTMEPLTSGIITEQCNQYATCTQLTSYEGHKAVFNAEYQSSASGSYPGYPGFCTYDDAHNINGALFNVNLDGPRSPCPGPS